MVPGEPTRGWVVRSVVVPPAHQISNPRFDICVSHKGEKIIQYMGGDVLVDNDVSAVTSSI
jgi:hypothetical protein